MKERNIETRHKRKNEPPLALVETWIWMMNESNDENLRQSGEEHLIGTFGGLAEADRYYSKHRI